MGGKLEEIHYVSNRREIFYYGMRAFLIFLDVKLNEMNFAKLKIDQVSQCCNYICCVYLDRELLCHLGVGLQPQSKLGKDI